MPEQKIDMSFNITGDPNNEASPEDAIVQLSFKMSQGSSVQLLLFQPWIPVGWQNGFPIHMCNAPWSSPKLAFLVFSSFQL